MSLDRVKSLINNCIEKYLREIFNRHGQDENSITNRRLLSGVVYDISVPPTRPPLSPLANLSVQSPLNKSLDSDGTKPDEARHIFQPLEDHLIASFQDCGYMNDSFCVSVSAKTRHTMSEELPPVSSGGSEPIPDPAMPVSELDAKTILLGDVAENGMWWAGGRTSRVKSQKDNTKSSMASSISLTSKSNKQLGIDWVELEEWYKTILCCGSSWRGNWRRLLSSGEFDLARHSDSLSQCEQEIEDDIAEARMQVIHTLMKSTENLLRRPGRPLKSPEDCRYLCILVTNPLLYNGDKILEPSISSHRSGRPLNYVTGLNEQSSTSMLSKLRTQHGKSLPIGKHVLPHSGVTKRVLGLMANLSSECYQAMMIWIHRCSEAQFRRLVEHVGRFVTHRLTRNAQSECKRSQNLDPTAGLVPDVSTLGGGTSAQWHAALGTSKLTKKPEPKATSVMYAEDWQIKAAAKFMSLLFIVNNGGLHGKSRSPTNFHRHAQTLPTSTFYNSLLDYADLTADFEIWESRRGKFTFCQYPMFLSIWAKIKIMEHDIRRQMEIKAREAFFNSIINRKVVNQYLTLKVRRECLVEDSLREVSGIVGAGQEEIRKGLRVTFLGEEGVDVGGYVFLSCSFHSVIKYTKASGEPQDCVRNGSSYLLEKFLTRIMVSTVV